MKPTALIERGLAYYWRTNLAVVLGVAAAVAVLSGALLVGDSVRGSLADLVNERLGKTDLAAVSSGFFREELAADLSRQPEFSQSFNAVIPLIATEGVVTLQEPAVAEAGEGNGRGARAGRVRVYGVDDRFWRFHGLKEAGLNTREAVIGAPLATELGATEGATILVRVEHPSDIPLESLHARKDDRVRTLRATIKSVAARNALGEFSLEAGQGAVRAVFLPLSLVQRELGMEGRVNTLLVSAKTRDPLPRAETLTAMLRGVIQLDDLGLHARALEERHEIVVDADSGVLDNGRTDAAIKAGAAVGLDGQTVFTYLANGLRIEDREVPYSLVTARAGVEPIVGGALPPIELNTWAAEQLHARVSDPLRMEYYVWEEPGQLVTRSADFQVSRIVPLDPSDRALAPVFPGITDSPTLEDWSPPFPVDLRRVRPVDEDYWKRYRTTPKAFIPIEVGQRLWRSRYGEATSVRMAVGAGAPITDALQRLSGNLSQQIDPFALGFTTRAVRAEGAVSSRGATDFGLYFVYFSFFLVIAALVVTALFFKLNVEQRSREIGLLRATGFGSGPIRRLFLGEGAALAVAGALVGLAAGVGYAALLIAALRTWWVGAVGTTALSLHVSPTSLAIGGLGGVAAALVCVWITLGSLARVSERRLLAGFVEPPNEAGGVSRGATRLLFTAISLGAAGAALVAAGAANVIDKPGAFFSAGALFVAACLTAMAMGFRKRARNPIIGRGSDRWSIYRLGLRNAAFRPARSVAAMSAIAAAAFILISVDAFRRSGQEASSRNSGTGGYALAIDLLVPIAQDPATDEGRKALALEDSGIGAIEPFRVRPGDDASCLNLYAPANPRIIAPKERLVRAGRFAFHDSLAETPAERANPWLLLEKENGDGAIPVIADANSITYVLKRSLGDDIVITQNGRAVKLRLVAALDDSIFQSELIMSERNFQKLFPEQEGYGFLLAESGSAPMVENALADFGADATATADRLAEFHRVENTYISTFQTLGGLGLLLGTAGLAAVLLRSAAERRRELALLRAIGYKPRDFFAMTLAENSVLLGSGLLIGAVCALLAIAPALMERGGQLPSPALIALLLATLVAGLVTSLGATAAVLRSPLLASLRSE